jgi:glycosyltransferase involved in cell wall biosynthesis
MRRLLGYYSRASVFCMMSDFEPLGIVVLEAGLCGVPAVCPRRFAFPEMIADHETGRLVDHYEPGELAAVLIDLLNGPDRLQAMGGHAQERVRREWTWDRAASRVVQRVGSDLNRETV